MSLILREAKKEIARLEKMKRIIEEFRKDEPAGCLKHQKRGAYTYFYQQYRNENTKKIERKFINKDNMKLVKLLAQKQYYWHLQSIIEINLKVLKHLVERYCPEKMDRVFDELSDECKDFITPLKGSREDRIREWYEEKYEMNSAYPENLRYETEQGELVRSKSEVIIANILYQHRDVLLYKYECPLKVKVAGKIIIIYPDFKIMNIRTGKITYWEHAGLMDMSDYADDFVRKVNTYINNNLLVGRDVVFSYETSENPLDTSVLRRMVEEIITK